MSKRASITQMVVRNWPIKLAAGFFAVMLYIAVAAQQPLSQSFAMRLAVTVPPGRTVRQQPAGVTVVLSGKGSEILKLRSFPRAIRKTIPDTFVAGNAVFTSSDPAAEVRALRQRCLVTV